MTKKKLIIICGLLIMLALIGLAIFFNLPIRSHGRPVIRHTTQSTKSAEHEVLPAVATYTPGFENFDRNTGRRLRGTRRQNLPAVVDANRKGALAKITIHVCDATGRDVANAQISGQFSTEGEGARPFKSVTDNSGRVVLEEQCRGEVYYAVNKDVHYNTRGQYWFLLEGEDCVKDGRWIPWNPTLEVVLKEKRKPIPMYQNLVEAVMPAGTNRLGFDFLVGDWIAPHGKGSIADMWYVYDETFIDRDNFYIKLSFAFPGENNGCYMRKTDNYSEFVSEHEATERGFEPSYVSVIEQEKGKYTKEKRFGENDYMIFRIRTKTDDQGKIISSHYGKIYGPVGVPHRWSKKFSFTYYLNPTPNDRNLEYDPKQNLVPEQQRHTMNRNLP